MNPFVDPERLSKLEERIKSGPLGRNPMKPTPPKEDENKSREDDLEQIRKALTEAQRNLSSKNSSITEEKGSLDIALEMADRIQKSSISQHHLQVRPGILGSANLSDSTSGMIGERSNRRRKIDKVDKGPDRSTLTPESVKKTKLTPTMKGQFINLEEKGQISDSSINSNDPNAMNKENNPISISTKKITDFFPKKDSSPQQKDSGKSSRNKSSKTKSLGKIRNFLTEIQDENDLSKSNDDKKIISNKMKEYEVKIRDLEKEKEKRDKFWEEKLERFESDLQAYKQRVQNTLARQVLENENHKRNERKNMLNQQKQRLGEYMQQRDGNKFVDIWMDGFEIRCIKEKIISINNEKEELEKQKKNLKPKKTLMPSSGAKGTFGVSGNLLMDSDSNSNIDTKENKERINARIILLAREEQVLKEQLEKLESEKFIYYQQYKRQYEEDHSRYGRPNQDTNAPAWPILHEKYQLLSLLGKGGFSEVYKAYDLDEFRYVACKIHQLNPNWSEKAKENYVKHATRETEVHKELNHPNIVRLYDSIDIDENSFATVLEYCEGPDLAFYLKQHKMIPEKEAKVIIRQIISGLKYLNDHKTKIIHYDLKPQNVLFHRGEIKISDFGLCKVVDPEVSRIELTSQGVGTYWYLPPECFNMDDNPPLINNKVDVWSVGVMFYEMLFGVRPFGNGMSQEKILKDQIILKAVHVNFPQKPSVTQEAKDFIKKCLAYNIEDRYDVHQAYNSAYFAKNK